MVLATQDKPYDLDFLQDMEGIQLSLVQKYDLPFVTEGGRVYESYQELFQLELIQCGLLAEEDELIFKEVPSDFIVKDKVQGEIKEYGRNLGFAPGAKKPDKPKKFPKTKIHDFPAPEEGIGGPGLGGRILTAVAGRTPESRGGARSGLKRDAGEKIGEAKEAVGKKAEVVGGAVAAGREKAGEAAAKVGSAKEAAARIVGESKERVGAAARSVPGKVEEGAEVVGQAAGVFAGKISNKARDIKAKMTSAATGLQVTGDALGRGFKAGLASQKAPTSDIYKRSPKEYWGKRGELATDKANADVKYNGAAKSYEESGDEAAFEEAVAEYGASITEVDRKAKEIGSSFEAVSSHVEALGQGRTRGIMPPSDGFPDAATKSGEEGSGQSLFDQTSKNLSGGLWSQKVVQQGEAWSQGKGKEESRFKGPGAEGEAAAEAYEAAGGAEGEEKGLREALKNPDEAVKNLPKGSNIDSGDREYLTKPGQQPPEGVQVHFGDPSAQGQRSRFYSKTEANIRRMARRQKAQGQADELGPEGEKSPEARRAKADQVKAGVQASPDPLAGGVGSVSESDINSFIQGLKDQGILKVPEPEEGDKGIEGEAAQPSLGAAAAPEGAEQQPRLPGFNGEAAEEPTPSPAEGEAAQPRLPGFNGEAEGEDDQQKREDKIVAERDERREGGPVSPETEPSEEPTSPSEAPTPDEPPPTPEAPLGIPKNVQSAIDRAERLADQGGRVASQYSRLVGNVDKFATQAANGDVRMNDDQVKGFLDAAEDLTESANASRAANKGARSKMNSLTRTQSDLESVTADMKTLEAAVKAGDDIDKKELKTLKSEQSKLKVKRTKQVSDARKAMGLASESKRALSASMKGVRNSIQSIKDNPAPDAPSRNQGWRRLVNKQPEGAPVPSPELPLDIEGRNVDIEEAIKFLENEGWGTKEIKDYIVHEDNRVGDEYRGDPVAEPYRHPANAESEMGSKYVPRAIKAAQKMSSDPILTSAIAGGAIKLSKDTQHLWEMLDMADDIIDKQLISSGNYSPLLFSIDSYLASYSYN